MKRKAVLSSLIFSLQAVLGSNAGAQDVKPTIDLSASYIADAIGISARDVKNDIFLLDNLDLTATIDLDRLIGAGGMTGHIHVLNNLGGNPNNAARTLQGIDNIEVGTQRLRLFEAWIEQRLGRTTTVRAGLYDLNSEFYTNDAAGLLIAPAFGVGSEIAATGPNGPSIFPSTALSVRIDQRIAADGYARLTVLNANAGTIGDAQGVNLTFNDGALIVGEAGLERGGGKLAIGAWSYTRRQADTRDIDPMGNPVARDAHGIYVVADMPVIVSERGPSASIFGRIGLSDGKTTSFKGGWQAGLLVQHVIAGRADSAFSIGLNQAYLARRYRWNLRDEGVMTAKAETAFEITYADRVHRNLMIQPDLQLVLDAAGERMRKPMLVAGLRMTVDI